MTVGKTYGGDIEVTVKMRYRMSSIQINGKPTKKKVLVALENQDYYDIMDDERLEIISVDDISELEEDPEHDE